jgi:hypothetical protein
VAEPKTQEAASELPLDRLDADRLAHFIELALDDRALLKLCQSLRISAPGYRLDRLAAADLAGLLADEYLAAREVRGEIEEAIQEALKSAALRSTWLTGAASREIVSLVSADPIISLARLAWRFFADEDPKVAENAARAVDAGLAILDAEAEAHAALQPAEGAPPEPAGAAPDEARHAEELEKKLARALRDREAARAQLQESRAEVAEHERRIAELKQEAASLRAEAARLGADNQRLAAAAGAEGRSAAAEARRLSAENRVLQDRIEEVRARFEEEKRRAAEAEKKLTQAAQAPAPQPEPAGEDAGPAEALEDAPGWAVPLFTREYYDSIERWDRRLQRAAFEKSLLLARDRRHPSLRAIALEGLPGFYRIRVATDVRLIYRIGEGGRIEILSLIDREDLDRYIRQAKGRQ